MLCIFNPICIFNPKLDCFAIIHQAHYQIQANDQWSWDRLPSLLWRLINHCQIQAQVMITDPWAAIIAGWLRQSNCLQWIRSGTTWTLTSSTLFAVSQQYNNLNNHINDIEHMPITPYPNQWHPIQANDTLEQVAAHYIH